MNLDLEELLAIAIRERDEARAERDEAQEKLTEAGYYTGSLEEELYELKEGSG